MTQLMKEVSSLVRNFLVNAGNLYAGFHSIFAALLLAGEASLDLLQSLFRFPEEIWRINFLAVRGRKEGFQAKIDTDLLTSFLRFDLHGQFTQDRDKIFAGRIYGDSDLFRFPLNHPVKPRLQGLHLGDRKKSGFDVNTEILRHSKGLFLSFLFEGREFKPIIEEIGIRSVKMPERLLKRLSNGFIEPDEFGSPFQLGKHPGRVVIVKALLLLAFVHGVVVNTFSKKIVVDKTTLTKLVGKNILLFFGWVDAISKCFIDYSFHFLHFNSLWCNCQEKSREMQAIYLPAKSGSFLAYQPCLEGPALKEVMSIEESTFAILYL